MSAELPRGATDDDRHPWDWYVEEPWVTLALASVIDLERDVTYLDPTCGYGHIPQALSSLGLNAYGTDIEQRTDAPFFMGEHDFLGDQVHMLEALPSLSIVMNCPYSNQAGRMVRGLAAKFVRKALSVATHKVCALLPVKWLASRERYALFSAETPIGIYILSERPSMPPGDKIGGMLDRAYRNGKVDYMWVVWDRRREPSRDRAGVPFAPTYWIPPRPKPSGTARLPLVA